MEIGKEADGVGEGLEGGTVGVPRQREKERTEPQTWDRAALGTLFRALGMYWLSRGLTLSINKTFS